MIRNFNHFRNSHNDHSWVGALVNDFSGGSDVDFEKEKNGYLFVIEDKWPGGKVNRGQWRKFRNMGLSGVQTTVVVWGKYSRPQRMQVWINGVPQKRVKATRRDIQELYAKWHRWACKQKLPEIENLDKPFSLTDNI